MAIKRKPEPDPPPGHKPTPTGAAPGTRKKLDELAARAEAGQELFHQADSQSMADETDRREFLKDPGCVTNSQGAPRVLRDTLPKVGRE